MDLFWDEEASENFEADGVADAIVRLVNVYG